MKTNVKRYVLLNVLLLLFSLSSVCSKLAAREEFMSFRFIMMYGFIVLLLGIYAIFWQQIIKSMPLTMAYANRAITVFWGMLWGLIIFHEKITPGKVAGAALVIAGIILFAVLSFFLNLLYAFYNGALGIIKHLLPPFHR